MDAVQKANSGHPGMPMGMADVALVLWRDFLKFDSKNPDWFDRDRFILSAGHGSMLIYALLHLSGHKMSLDDIKNFRQWGSNTPGHPENFETEGVEMTTGPLGQGISTAVGFAMAEKHLAARINKDDYEVVDHYTYVIASDGDLMEGVSYEAASLAGHWKLGKLVVLYDDNGITIDGSTDLAFSENVSRRFKSQGWHTQSIDGHDPKAIKKAIEKAKSKGKRPSIICCKTHIGYGSPNRQDKASSHGSPLGDDEIALTKEGLGWPVEPKFIVPAEAKNYLGEASMRGAEVHSTWKDLLSKFNAADPDAGALFERLLKGEYDHSWIEDLPDHEVGSKEATRATSGKVLGYIKAKNPNLVGGSADLSGSNKTKVADDDILSAANPGGRYIHYGIREHAMGAIMNGMNLHGGLRAFGGTFLIFSDYVRPSIRLAALMKANSIFVFSHDSIGLGEDGPTHQPVEHLMSLRAIPNLKVLRPADTKEVSMAWKLALDYQGPSAIALTRQVLPLLDRSDSLGDSSRGGYVVRGKDYADVILMASGSEVEIAVEASIALEAENIHAKVVSIMSMKTFDEQGDAYRESVLPAAINRRISLEAGITSGWQKYTGTDGIAVGIDHFGASAPYERIYEEFGLTSSRLVELAKKMMTK